MSMCVRQGRGFLCRRKPCWPLNISSEVWGKLGMEDGFACGRIFSVRLMKGGCWPGPSYGSCLRRPLVHSWLDVLSSPAMLQGQVRIQGQDLTFKPLKPTVSIGQTWLPLTWVHFQQGRGDGCTLQYNKVHNRISPPGKGKEATDMAYTSEVAKASQIFVFSTAQGGWSRRNCSAKAEI